jgi:hypothetical protein
MDMTFRQISPHIRQWSVADEHGAVSFGVFGDPLVANLVIHRPIEPGDPRAAECDLLEAGACLCDPAYRAAADLLGTCQRNGFDADVIRAELEYWHASRFAPAARA